MTINHRAIHLLACLGLSVSACTPPPLDGSDAGVDSAIPRGAAMTGTDVSRSMPSASKTATLQDVTTYSTTAPPAYTPPAYTVTSVSAASGAFAATVDLTAVLSTAGTGLGGRMVSFTLSGASAGLATTDAQGTATVTGVRLVGLAPGVYYAAV